MELAASSWLVLDLLELSDKDIVEEEQSLRDDDLSFLPFLGNSFVNMLE